MVGQKRKTPGFYDVPFSQNHPPAEAAATKMPFVRNRVAQHYTNLAATATESELFISILGKKVRPLGQFFTVVKISFAELKKIALHKAYKAYPASAKDTIKWLFAASLFITPLGKQV